MIASRTIRTRSAAQTQATAGTVYLPQLRLIRTQ
jgi:hypothetical protein